MNRYIITLFLSGSILLQGCVSVISTDVLQKVNRNIAFSDLMKNPLHYKGEMVLLGGVIVQVTNMQDGSLLEVYQTEIDFQDRPIHPDVSEGRFMAWDNGFLDNEIYEKGREVTIAGTVLGERTKKIGELIYHYPYLSIREIHLWKKEEEPRPIEPSFWYPMPGPWRPWGPWNYMYWAY